MAKKSSSKIKNLNAPKKVTWLIAFLATIAGLITGIVSLVGGAAWAGIASLILLFASSVLMLLSSYVKGL